MLKLRAILIMCLVCYSRIIFAEVISLNFQDIEVRAALKMLAEFNNKNIIVSDAVQGNITLRLDSVEFEEALDVILQAKGLAQLQSGNVMLIDTKEEISARLAHAESSAALQSKYYPIKYAKAMDIMALIKDKASNLLSARGQVSTDPRTNALFLKDTPEHLTGITNFINHLDVPVRQVMIEAQIVETIDNYNENFGVRISSKHTNINSVNDLYFDFNDSSSSFGLSLVRLPVGLLIDLELKASELEEKTKTVARPKIVTQDGQTAIIEAGQEIPYTTTIQHGSTPITTFKTAALKLEVTPQITPNNSIVMNLHVNDDSPNNVACDGQVGINTTSMSTKILVEDGETIVLGGIFKTNDSIRTQAIPYLGKLPYIGRLFSFNNKIITKNEVFIFVTTRIIDKLNA